MHIYYTLSGAEKQEFSRMFLRQKAIIRLRLRKVPDVRDVHQSSGGASAPPKQKIRSGCPTDPAGDESRAAASAPKKGDCHEA